MPALHGGDGGTVGVGLEAFRAGERVLPALVNLGVLAIVAADDVDLLLLGVLFLDDKRKIGL
jgi:hypothetical protein